MHGIVFVTFSVTDLGPHILIYPCLQNSIALFTNSTVVIQMLFLISHLHECSDVHHMCLSSS